MVQQDGQDQNAPSHAGEAIIDEASPEQEDGESQNQFQNQQSNILNMQVADDLSTEQIIELLQNAQNISQNGETDENMFDENGNPIQQLPEEVQLQL